MDTDAMTTVTLATTDPTAEQNTIASLKHFVVERPVPKLVKSNGQSSIEWTAKATEVDPPANTEVVEANLGQFFTKVFKENNLMSQSTSKTYLRVVESPSHTEQDLNRASQVLSKRFSSFCETYIDGYDYVILQASRGCYTGPYKFEDEEEDNGPHAEEEDEVAGAHPLQ